MRWAAFCGSRSTRGKGHLHSNNNRLQPTAFGAGTLASWSNQAFWFLKVALPEPAAAEAER
jgi:hypothetical protein